MAKQNEDGKFTRPRMFYGCDSPTIGIPDRESTHKQQVTEGSADSGRTQSKATLVRSYSRKLRKSSQTQLFPETLPRYEPMSVDAVPAFVQLSASAVGGQGDGSVRDRQLDSSTRERRLDSNFRDRQLDSSVKGRQLESNFRDRQLDSSVKGRQLESNFRDRQLDSSVKGRQLDSSVKGRQLDSTFRGRQSDSSVVERKFNESVIVKEVDDIVMDRQFNESREYLKVDESAVDRQFNESFVNRTYGESSGDRNVYSSVLGRKSSSEMGRKLSGSVIDGQLDRSLVKRKSSESSIGRKSSLMGGAFVESRGDRTFAESVKGRKSSRYSIKLTPIVHRRRSVTSKAESRNQTNKSQKSRLVDCLISRLDDISRSTSCYNKDIVDENFLISAAKLDSTLIRLFSHARENHGETKDEQDPGTALMPFLNYSQSDLINMDAVMWRVFPMDAAQRETLDQELPYMEENLTSYNVMRHLFDKSILTHMDYNQLARTEGQGEKAVTRLMVKTLQRRGDKAYPAFLEALQAHNYLHICHRLAGTERCLRDAMAASRSDSGNRSKIVHVSVHQYQSGKTSQLRNLTIAEANESSTTPTSISSANRVAIFDNDTGLTNHIHSLDQSSLGGASNVKQETPLEEIPTCDLRVVDSKQLENQLLELMEEFESLQREVIAMKSAPSPQGSVDTHSNSDEVESELHERHLATNALSTSDTESIATDLPECNRDLTPGPPSRNRTQKSVSCIVL